MFIDAIRTGQPSTKLIYRFHTIKLTFKYHKGIDITLKYPKITNRILKEVSVDKALINVYVKFSIECIISIITMIKLHKDIDQMTVTSSK